MLINLDALVPLFNRCADSAAVSRNVPADSQAILAQGSSSSRTGSQRSMSWRPALQLLARPAVGGALASKALTVAADDFQLIHPCAGVYALDNLVRPGCK